MRTATIHDYDLYHNLQDSDFARHFQSRVIEAFPPDKHPTVLDFGCGRGHAVKRFADAGYECHGLDASNTAIAHGPAMGIDPKMLQMYEPSKGIQYPEHFFDLVFSADVLEHISESMIPTTITELARVCKNMMVLSICFRPAVSLAETGIQWHATIKPREWWQRAFEIFAKHFEPVAGWESDGEPNLFVYRRVSI